MNERRKDNLRDKSRLPTATERSQEKGGPPKDRGLAKFWKWILGVGVGSILIVSALILWPLVPQGEVSGILSFLEAPAMYPIYGISAVGAGVIVVIICKRTRPSKPASETSAPQAAPPEATSLSPQEPPAQPPTPQGSESGPKFARCKLCPATFRYELDTWVSLFRHLEDHYRELEGLFVEFPSQSVVDEMISRWFTEN